MKKYAAEFLGTFTMVFAGTGAIIVNDLSGGKITHVGVAMTFGLVVMAMVYALGNISGAHLIRRLHLASGLLAVFLRVNCFHTSLAKVWVHYLLVEFCV